MVIAFLTVRWGPTPSACQRSLRTLAPVDRNGFLLIKEDTGPLN